ncbi:MAG TPA: S9 family peptidase [Thermoanaerobaculia bacterium]
MATMLTAALPLLAESSPTAPPVAKTVPRSFQLHGDTIKDDYYWLREKDSPDVLAYLKAENAYADEVMKETEAFQSALYKEMLSRIKETDLSVPWAYRGWLYYSRTEKGKQYRINCRKKGPDGPEQVLLDLNELARGEKFLGLSIYEPSDDGNLLAYSTDVTGFREYSLRIKDLRTGELLPDRAERVTSAAWADDNKTLFYTTQDHAKRAYRVWRREVGRGSEAVLVYEEGDEHFNVGVWKSRSGSWIFLATESQTQSEVRAIPSAKPTAEMRMLIPRAKDLEYSVDHGGDLFYITINDRGRNFRVVTVPVADTDPKSWKEIVPHKDDVMITGLSAFAGYVVVNEREAGLPRLRVIDLASGQQHRVEFDEPAYALYSAVNAEFDTTKYRFNYESFVTPDSVYDYDMKTRERSLLKRTDVLGGYDPANYREERIFATAADGVKVPISILTRKDFVRDGKSPLLLYAYGSYGAPMYATFDSNVFSYVDRGVSFAVAHIRGGGEMGKKWHDDGRMMKKKNTFTDFIAAAEHLVAQKYTSADRLAIEGGSAGGLLMGAVTNMRPDLFKVVVSKVPFVDVINTMLDDDLPLTYSEFEEWGNPKDPVQYAYMKSYCPYTNIEKKNYPTILVKTSYNDSQVMYWEPAKYVAKLRSRKTDGNPLVFKINMAGGHGGSSGRYDKLHESAFDTAFVLTQLGITK